MEDNIILETRELSKAFGALKVVDRVSFSLKSKCLCALIGPNGAGKTSLFNVITGVLKEDKGMVIFEGIDITHHESYEICRRGLSRTFQITSIFPRLSVFENVQASVISQRRAMMNLVSKGKQMFKEEVLDILDITGLAGRVDEISGALSHGYQKRLELAIALANKPKMLLLDEPTCGIAPEATGEMMDLVKRLRDEMSLSVLFVEHDMGVVFGWADRVIVLHQGRIIADGLPAEIRNNKQVHEVYLGDEV